MENTYTEKQVLVFAAEQQIIIDMLQADNDRLKAGILLHKMESIPFSLGGLDTKLWDLLGDVEVSK